MFNILEYHLKFLSMYVGMYTFLTQRNGNTYSILLFSRAILCAATLTQIHTINCTVPHEMEVFLNYLTIL
jgi:hypothetical protein